MKSLKLLLFMILTASTLLANSEVVLKSKIENVTVFTNGAEISRSVLSNVNKGISNLVVSHLENNIDINSLQASIKGKVTILSINQRTNFLTESEKPDRIVSLEKELEKLTDKKFYLTTEKEVIEEEIEMILANKVLGSEQKGVKISDLKEMSAYYNDRLLKIKINHREKVKSIEKIEKEITKLKKQIDEFIGKFKMPVNEVVVKISANEKTKVNLNLSYVIYNAGWSPSYDLRVTDINSKVKLNYNAKIWQNSGIDWNDVNITLSTRNPRQNNNKPILNPWYLNFVQPRPPQIMAQKLKRMDKSIAMESVEMDEAETMAGYMEVEEKQLAAEFTPSIKVTIPSDGKQHNIALQEQELDAKYEYYSAPRLREAAYLVAYISDLKSANLIPGNSNIYFEGSYVGKVYLNPRNFDKEFPISLGKDDNIFVNRKQIKDFTEDKFLSSNIERKFAYEIEILNNKKADIDIVVEDNLPISQHEDIEVELIDKSGAELNKDTGILKWKFTLEPNQSKKQKLIYSIIHPQNRQIDNL